MIRLRFAPTPVGHLLVGHARVALANALFAQRHGGHVLLRLDDTDAAHCKPSFAEALVQDLQWLGIGWDAMIRQSERLALYTEAADRLKQAGRLYPCFESPEELRFKQEQRRKRGKPTIYDRAMLRLTPAQRAAAEANGKRPHWRLRLSDRLLVWDDLVAGRREVKLQSVSDPVAIAADGTFLPAFASVVDDIETGITHVIRSEENAANAGVQLDLFDALRARPPRFAHLPGLSDDVHRRLGRRVGSLTVRSLRADGVEPIALATCLVAPALEAAPESLAALAAGFELPAGTGAQRFDTARLLRLNRQILATTDFASVAARLPGGATETFWLAVRGEIDLLSEARGWWDVVSGTIVPPVMAGEQLLLRAAQETLPAEPWDRTVLTTWLAQLGDATGRHGQPLLAPLRLALTGEDSGPDLGALLPLIGRTRAANRLQIAAS
ncbi:MAG: glutamate--tRNA ligase family protein [Acetobacteraceae bacterium]|nr:glutamate--tRNA ligase family protein [Acetobacteraceae bacterium]